MKYNGNGKAGFTNENFFIEGFAHDVIKYPV